MTQTHEPAPARALVLPGTLVGERYEILDFIGEGGFASVYRARDVLESRIVALKLLDGDSQLMDMRTYRARFFREAEVATRIDHPHVVRIFDFGVAADINLPYLAMELLEGHDLEHEITCFGALDPARAVRLFLPVLDALARGHTLGIIHRDLKPANLFLCDPHGPAERLVLLDFGVAKLDDKTAVRLTTTGQLFGTPVFAAPEWIRQQISTPALDVYQVGLILVEALCGEAVIRTDSPFECLNIHCQGRLELPVDLLYGPMAQVFSKALALDHEVRYADAGELRDALAEVDLAQLPPRIAPGPRRRLVQPPGSRVPADVMTNVTSELESPEAIVARLRTRRRNLLVASAILVAIVGLAVFLAATHTEDAGDARAAIVAVPEGSSESQPRHAIARAARIGSAASVGHGVAAAHALSISLDSRPSGARVLRDGVELGTTPLRVAFASRAAEPVELRLVLSGYQAETIRITPDSGPEHVERLKRHKRRRGERDSASDDERDDEGGDDKGGGLKILP